MIKSKRDTFSFGNNGIKAKSLIETQGYFVNGYLQGKVNKSKGHSNCALFRTMQQGGSTLPTYLGGSNT